MWGTGKDVSRRAESLLAGSHGGTFHDTLKRQTITQQQLHWERAEDTELTLGFIRVLWV